MNDRENARKSITEHLAEVENDNVLRSMCFVLGDFLVQDNGDERASYIASILQNIILCKELENLSKIYVVAKVYAESEA